MEVLEDEAERSIALIGGWVGGRGQAGRAGPGRTEGLLSDAVCLLLCGVGVIDGCAESLQGELAAARQSRQGLVNEVHRLEQLVEEQSRTISGLAARNASMEVEVRGRPLLWLHSQTDRQTDRSCLSDLRPSHVSGVCVCVAASSSSCGRGRVCHQLESLPLDMRKLRSEKKELERELDRLRQVGLFLDGRHMDGGEAGQKAGSRRALLLVGLAELLPPSLLLLLGGWLAGSRRAGAGGP